MTYGELNNLKTAGFVTNHVIDDALGNARWCNKYGWADDTVPAYVINQIKTWAQREGVEFCAGEEVAA